MFQIVRKQEMAAGTIIRFDISAPKIAKKIKAGQFIILRVNETGERIPLTVADKDEFAGIITIIFQVVGKTTALMRSLNEGDLIKDVVGPLGRPAEAEKIGTVLMVGGGTGVAILHHVAKAFKEAGNYVIGIMGAKDKEMLILENEMAQICAELVITTDDGSYGERGFVTQPLDKYLGERDDIKLVYAIGPIIMMKNWVILVNMVFVWTLLKPGLLKDNEKIIFVINLAGAGPLMNCDFIKMEILSIGFSIGLTEQTLMLRMTKWLKRLRGI